MNYRLIQSDVLEALRSLPDELAQVIVTSPPYWQLRLYDGVGPTRFSDGEFVFGFEATPEHFIEHFVEVARELRRVLRKDGSLFLNFGHCFIGGTVPRARGWKDKDLCPLPWLAGLALQRDGWWIRCDNIWGKRSSKPSPVRDRPAISHEYVTQFSRSARYFLDDDAWRKPYAAASIARRQYADTDVGPRITEHQPDRRSPEGLQDPGLRGGAVRHYPPNPQGRRIRSIEVYDVDPGPHVMVLPGAQFFDEHTATFPEELCVDPIRAGSSDTGACAECGAPLARQVELGEPLHAVRAASGANTEDGRYEGGDAKVYDTVRSERPADIKNRTLESMRERITVGWRATCRGHLPAGALDTTALHAAGGLRPCVVLDPFSGTGTTGVVALKLGRSYVGIDASASYMRIAERRLAEAGGVLARRVG